MGVHLVGLRPPSKRRSRPLVRSSRSAARSARGRHRRRRIVSSLSSSRWIRRAPSWSQTPSCLGGSKIDVVDVPGVLHAHTPAREALHELLVGHVDQQRGGERGGRGPRAPRRARRPARACAESRRAGTVAGVVRPDPLGDHADDQIVGHQLAGVHVALGRQAELGAVGHLRRAGCRRWRCGARRSRRAGGRPAFPCLRPAVPAGSGSSSSNTLTSLSARARRPARHPLLEEALVAAHHQLGLELLHRVERDADDDQDRGPAEAELHWCVRANRIVGSAATAARKSAPGSVSRARMRSRNSAVGRPGRTPGMNPPYFFRLSAWSTGLNVTAV